MLLVSINSRRRRMKLPDASEFVFVLPNDQARIAPVVEFLAAEAISCGCLRHGRNKCASAWPSKRLW